MKQYCDLCEKRCPIDALGCGEGRQACASEALLEEFDAQELCTTDAQATLPFEEARQPQELEDLKQTIPPHEHDRPDEPHPPHEHDRPDAPHPPHEHDHPGEHWQHHPAHEHGRPDAPHPPHEHDHPDEHWQHHPPMPEGPHHPPMPGGPHHPPMPGGPHHPPMPGGPHHPPMPEGPHHPPMPEGPHHPPLPGGPHHPPMPGAPHHPPLPGGPLGPGHGRPRFRPEEVLRFAQSAGPLELLDICHRELHRPEAGVARGQGRAMAILAEREVMSQRELQDMLRIQPASMSELIGKLERKGYLTRERGEDRRSNLLRITEVGKEAAAAAGDAPGDELLAALSAEQRKQLAEALRLLLADWLGRF